MRAISFFHFWYLNFENGTKIYQVIYCLSIKKSGWGKMTPKIRKIRNSSSKWNLDETDGNIYNHIKTTYFMHISVPYLVKYTNKANIFALKISIRGPSNKWRDFSYIYESVYHLNISNITIMCITCRACNNISNYLIESEVDCCLSTKN